ncbi:MAG: ANTAR domain-containing response regulator [Planctomycetota bacterium JB042]
MSRSFRIAVADDEAVMRDYFREILPDLGHEVVAAASTGKALVEECLRHRPDLVITDIRMPEMDGIDAAAEITRQLPIPIILVSAFSDRPLIERAKDSMVLSYLIKPIQQASLETAIEIAGTRFEEVEALRREAGDLRQALEDRKLIERAKGILMRRLSVDEDTAFARLRKAAMEQSRKLVDVARTLIQAEKLL